MPHRLPKPILGALTFSLMTLNTLLLSSLLLTLAIAKFLLPIPVVSVFFTGQLMTIAMAWVRINNMILALTQKIQWDVSGLEGLDTQHWYFLTSNHQSWVDIVVLQKICSGHIPFIKFFLKKQLIWVPILGVVWWALDFPFMQRFSKEALAGNPKLRDKDRAITEKACARFMSRPTTVMNFLEGTRFTQEKHDRQNSPFQHLLKPKAGGIAFALGTMGQKIHALIDVTIVYQEKNITLWKMLSGDLRKITVRVRQLPIPMDFFNKDYNLDAEFKAKIQAWLNQLWAEKNALIAELNRL